MKGSEGRQSKGTIGHAHRVIEGMGVGCNTQEVSGEEKVGAIGGTGTADVWGRDPIGGALMGDNGPRHKSKRGGSWYWAC